MSAEGDDARSPGRRWAIFLVPASIYLFSYFHRVAPAVVATDLMREFAIPASTLGALAAIYPYTFAAMALVAGSLVETLGSRWTLTTGCVAVGAGSVLFGIAPVFSVAVAGRLLTSLGASVILVAWLTLLAQWFRADEFATVSGSTQGVGNVGALLASTPLALAVEVLGWRESFVVIGAGTMLLAIGSAPLLRDRPLALTATPAVHGPETLGAVLRGIPSVIANARTWPPALAAAAVYATAIAFLGLWGAPYLMHVYGLDRVQAASTLAPMPMGLIVGSPLVGWLSDRWFQRRRVPFVVFTALYTLCWLPLALATLRLPPALLPLLFFGMGLTASALILVWACVREVNDPARVGIAMGFCNMPIFLVFAVVQWLLGVVLDAHWEGLAVSGARLYTPRAYEAAFSVCLAIAAAGVVSAALVTETRGRNVWRPATAR
jgi:sugar phosphate permease